MKEFLLNILLTIDQNIVEFVKIPKDRNFNSNKKNLVKLSKIVKRCKEENIFVGILGSWALTIYLNQEFKNIEDIDLTTNDVSFESLKKILLELGYKKVISNWPNMDCFEKNRINIDIYCVDNKKHLYHGLPLKIEEIEYQGMKYPVVSKGTLFKMYKKAFLRPGRSIKKDLVKLKILRNIQD